MLKRREVALLVQYCLLLKYQNFVLGSQTILGSVDLLPSRPFHLGSVLFPEWDFPDEWYHLGTSAAVLGSSHLLLGLQV